MRLFGFEIKRQEQDSEPQSFAPPQEDDGAVIVAAGGVYGTYVDLEGSAKTEAELVTKYRDMTNQPEVDQAVDDIVNEAIVSEPEVETVSINLDRTNASSNIKKLIAEEFDAIKKLLNFDNQAYDIFRRYYVDGRLYYHAIIDDKKPEAGLKELRYVDPRKIRKVKEVKKKRDRITGATLTEKANEYFLYSEKGYYNAGNSNIGNQGVTGGVRIAKDSIIHVTSGLMDTNNTIVLSHLHKAIKVLNQLRTLEDATVIYRISRAPERRIFYIDVGNLPKMKAEQYLRDMMIRHKNRVVYDSQTGEIRDDRKFMTMLEDYWLPRREGNKGTEITTLPGGQNLGEMTDVNYFQKKLYRALNVPGSRLEAEQTFNVGRSTEITRDEVKFSKFVNRLRSKFSSLFIKSLEKQVVLKKIMTLEEWQAISQDIKFDFAKDNYFAELKEIEAIRERVSILRDIDDFAGKYVSHAWIRKNVLRQTEEEIEEMDEQMEAELDDPRFAPPEAPAQEQPPASADGSQGENTQIDNERPQ
jgi:hypothetical protein